MKVHICTRCTGKKRGKELKSKPDESKLGDIFYHHGQRTIEKEECNANEYSEISENNKNCWKNSMSAVPNFADLEYKIGCRKSRSGCRVAT